MFDSLSTRIACHKTYSAFNIKMTIFCNFLFHVRSVSSVVTYIDIGAVGLGLNSWAGQIGNSVANGSLLGLDPIIIFQFFKFKILDFEKMKFKFIDFEKTKFKFKFSDFEKMKFKFKLIDCKKRNTNSLTLKKRNSNSNSLTLKNEIQIY